ncbi:MAG: hypothetical protein GF401_07620 [Chitinivibrionales bacterium]|nr:hypothetical protein [Chitinivibrionales bacterium]
MLKNFHPRKTEKEKGSPYRIYIDRFLKESLGGFIPKKENSFAFFERFKGKINQKALLLKLKLFRNTKKKYFVYYHLPKTAGTAVKYYSRKRNLTNSILTLPHEYTVNNIKFRNNNVVKFGTVRNPLSWYVSLYKFKIESKEKDYSGMRDTSFRDFFNDLVLFKNGKEGIKRWHKPWRKNSAPFKILENYHPQFGFYSNNVFYYFGREINLETAKTENINQDLEKIFQGKVKLKIESKINTSGHSYYMDYYTAEMIEEIKNRDRIIFEKFYPKEL